MSRNVTLLVVALVIILIFGYLLVLRNRFQTIQVPVVPAPTVSLSPTSQPEPVISSPSASPSASVSPGKTKISPTVTPRVSTPSGRTIR